MLLYETILLIVFMFEIAPIKQVLLMREGEGEGERIFGDNKLVNSYVDFVLKLREKKMI